MSLFRRRRSDAAGTTGARRHAARERALMQSTGDLVVILDDTGRVASASAQAIKTVPGVRVGEAAPRTLDGDEWQRMPIQYDGARETLVYRAAGRNTTTPYEELRTEFTAAVSHELRTPLARLLALLESVLLPGANQQELVAQARVEVEQARELIDEILFLSELETGTASVGLGSTRVVPIVREAVARLEERAARAGVKLRVAGDESATVPLRPRMLGVVAENLAENAIRHAGPGSTFTVDVERGNSSVILRAVDDGVGVSENDVPRLFERFYRGDRSRASRGTGLGLSIVKHIVASAGGTVEAYSERGGGLEIVCTFPST